MRCKCLAPFLVFLTITMKLYSASTSAQLSKEHGSENSCDLVLHECNYTVSVSPSNQCHGNHETKEFRKKRDVVETQPVFPEYVNILSMRLKQVQNRLTKEMKSLSTRVLRGVRRMESTVTGMSSKPRRFRAAGEGKACPAGFVMVDNWPHCYLFSRFSTSWYEARDFCAAFGSDMAALGTLKEHYIVTFLIKNDKDLRDEVGWWTSGTFISKTKQWMWTSDLEMRPFSFIKWAANEPNESSHQCVMLNRTDDHLWHDELCTSRFNFICAMPTE